MGFAAPVFQSVPNSEDRAASGSPSAPIPLAELAAQIADAHRAAEASAKEVVRNALSAGRLLCVVKQQLAHGEFLPWVDEHCPFSRRTAQGYMRLANDWPTLSEQMRDVVAHLPLRVLLNSSARRAEAGHDEQPPAEFAKVEVDDTDYACPNCGHEWHGDAKPKAGDR